MNVYLIGQTLNPVTVCGEAAATCTASDDYFGALRGAMAAGHMSVVEHACFTFRIEGVSRVLLAQLTRHRLASFSVESQRYVKGSGLTAIVPDAIAADPGLAERFEQLQYATTMFYNECLARGIEAEDARYGLLQGGTTNLVMTMNVRELRHFLSLRCCNRAQWEIRHLADRILQLCMEAAPDVFRGAGCACMQGKPCPEGRKSCGRPRKLEDIYHER